MKKETEPANSTTQQFSSIKFWHFPIDPYHYPVDPPTGGYGGTSIGALAEYAGRSRAPLLRDAIQSSLSKAEPDATKAKTRSPAHRTKAEQRLSASGPAILAELIVDEIRKAVVPHTTNLFAEAAKSSNLGLQTSSTKSVDKIRNDIYDKAQKEAALVAKRRKRRSPEQLDEILAQAADLPVFFAAAVGLQAAKHANTLMLLDLALRATNIFIFQLKHVISCPRPAEFIPAIAPVVLTPSHGSYPSGHATQAFLIAHILSELRSDKPISPAGVKDLKSLNKACEGNALYRLAYGVADNRVIAGVHYPMDSVAGFALGCWFGESIKNAGGSTVEEKGGLDLMLPHLWRNAVEEWT